MFKIMFLVLLLTLTTSSKVQADPADWLATQTLNVCQEGLDLGPVGRGSMNDPINPFWGRPWAEGTIGAETHGMIVPPENFETLARLDRTVGPFNSFPNIVPVATGYYFYADLTGSRILAVGTGEPDESYSASCTETEAWKNPVNHLADGAADGTPFPFSHIGFRTTGYGGYPEIYVILLDTTTGTPLPVTEIRLNNLCCKTASQPAWEDIKITLELLIAPGLEEETTGTYIAGDTSSMFNNTGTTIDDLWEEQEGIVSEETVPLSSYSVLERADLNMDGVVGGPDFTLFAINFGKAVVGE